MQKENRLIFRGRAERPELNPDKDLGRISSLSFDDDVDDPKKVSSSLNDAALAALHADEAEKMAKTEVATEEVTAQGKREKEFIKIAETDSDGNPIDWFLMYKVGTGGRIKASGADFHRMIDEKHGEGIGDSISVYEDGGDMPENAEWNEADNCYKYNNGKKVVLRSNHTYELNIILPDGDDLEANAKKPEAASIDKAVTTLDEINSRFFSDRLEIRTFDRGEREYIHIVSPDPSRGRHSEYKVQADGNKYIISIKRRSGYNKGPDGKRRYVPATWEEVHASEDIKGLNDYFRKGIIKKPE